MQLLLLKYYSADHLFIIADPAIYAIALDVLISESGQAGLQVQFCDGLLQIQQQRFGIE